MGVAKPLSSAFQRVEMVFRPIACNELMHVGDSVDADYYGALAAGWRALLLRADSAPLDDYIADDVIASIEQVLKRV
jgi:FMN phosphatase YigB (HAD superfamily)